MGSINEQLTRTISRNSYSNTITLIISGLIGDVHLVSHYEIFNESPLSQCILLWCINDDFTTNTSNETADDKLFFIIIIIEIL